MATNNETLKLVLKWCMKEGDIPPSKIDMIIQLCVYCYEHGDSVRLWIMSDVLNSTADRGGRAMYRLLDCWGWGGSNPAASMDVLLLCSLCFV